MTDLPQPSVPVSWGELLDKLTILAIKEERITAAEARANVRCERQALAAIGEQALRAPEVEALAAELRQVNEALWEIEDAIRAEDAHGRFGDAFVTLARSVYQKNDERAAIKRRINQATRSALVEEKSYAASGDMRPELSGAGG